MSEQDREQLVAALEERNRQLQLAQERLRDIIEHTADAIVVVDREGSVQFANTAAEALFGRPRDQLVGSPLGFPLVGGETTELDLAGQRVAEMRVVEVPWDGRPAWLASLRDVTARRDAEQAARRLWRERTAHEEAEKERARLQELLAQAPAAVLSTRGPEHVCVFVNPGMERLVGGRGLLGRPLAVALPELAGQGFLEGFDRALRDGASGSCSELHVRLALAGRGTTEWHCLDVTWEPLCSDGRVDGVMCFAHDVTAQYETRRRLEAAMERLREEERRKDQFMAVLGHELRNPLAGIDGGLRLLEEGAGGERARWALAMMRKQVRQLTSLLDDLLDVSKVARGKLELRRRVVALEQVIEAALAATSARFEERGQRLALAVPEQPLHVDGDAERLGQVMANLLVNACKYSRPGSDVFLSVRAEGNEAVIEVRDQGFGIAREMLQQIFEPFIQATGSDGSPLAGGLGIGLTLVKQLVELHGGVVTAASPGLGRGSTFTVRLPLADPAALGEAESPPAATLARGQRVLVVDDNRDAATALTELLNLSGCRAEAAGSGAEALAAARKAPFDVVLLDLDLPDMTGYRVAERLRADAGGGAPLIVAVSGFGQEEARERSRQSGIDHHLVKPVELAEVLRLITAHATPA